MSNARISGITRRVLGATVRVTETGRNLIAMLIDDRAGSRELVLIPPLNECAMLTRLESADVAITGNGPTGLLSVGVEVKSVSDLLQSEGNGRLQDQLSVMLDQYDVSWLLTHGQYRAGPFNRLEIMRGRWRTHRVGNHDVPFGYLEGVLLTANVAGISHKHVYDEEQAAAWLACLERWWDKPWGKHKSFHKFNRAGDVGVIPDIGVDMLQRMRIAADLPGVGWERALAAAVSFNSVRSMINATEHEWCDVPGIGKVIAKQIVRAVS